MFFSILQSLHAQYACLKFYVYFSCKFAHICIFFVVTWSAMSTAVRAISTAGRVSMANINPKLVGAQYAVRGELVLRAGDYQTQLKKPNHGEMRVFYLLSLMLHTIH